eukprot:6750627-Pyramimonas_sp.AAC.2
MSSYSPSPSLTYFFLITRRIFILECVFNLIAGFAADYLYEIGRQAANMRTEVGQNKTNLDALFAGRFLGVDSDIASGELRKIEFRSLQHIQVRVYPARRLIQLTI